MKSCYRVGLTLVVATGLAALPLMALEKRAPAVKVDARTGISWVRVAGGSFQMGAASGGTEANELPVHSVTVKSFDMARTGVTVGQYRRCVEAGVCSKPSAWPRCHWSESGGDDIPVNCVTWDQAASYAKWAGGRLPSEAEWEFAARSIRNDGSFQPGNQKSLCEHAVGGSGGSGCKSNETWPVCSRTAGSGLCDMPGAIWEWVQDWYHVTYEGAPVDGSAWENPVTRYRVTRGGALRLNATRVSITRRDGFSMTDSNRDIGFRIVRPVPKI